ncbi:S8 family serine peptidase [Flavobacterium sp.]|uniref:S8 family peptidase n=1 Tax=Flavobacterium sp. TaxID=239 RepID=UPI0025C24A0F|nr:S8 family serine peptidase [Flavobacterium sp.]MBA4154715.1 hypothetical protein [Flavobacterium sp.]
MKKFYSTSLFLFLGIFLLTSQSNHFYYYKGQKIYLTADKSKVSITTNLQFQKSSIYNLSIKDFDLVTYDNQKFSTIEFLNEPTEIEFIQKLNTLKSNPNINHVNLFFKRGDGVPPIGISTSFYIKIKNQSDLPLLQTNAALIDAQVVNQVPYMPLWYILKLNTNSIENTLTATSKLWETGLFEEVDPGFLFDFSPDEITGESSSTNNTTTNCVNDTNFSALWGLDNATNHEIDINACAAWEITEGQGIRVAVIDNGIDKTHLDLIDNIDNLSFNMNNGSSPSAIPNDFHGTHIAGTIAAIKDNNLQVTGVAPKSKLIDVSHDGFMVPNQTALEYASGISWAWQTGADILNCSWGDHNGVYYSIYHSSILESSILNALTLGRNGKGTIVVFASGNHGGNYAFNYGGMDYPGIFSNDIITVGGINEYGQRAIFTPEAQSSYGVKLDVVAPGINITSTNLNSEILESFGTSFAAPHVTGIAALILSVNPNLTQKQVADIIEQTAQKVGGYGYNPTTNRPNGNWNMEMGYGLVDAHAAVLMAQQMISTPYADLYIADNPNDFGYEPSVPLVNWNSPSIWVRNQNYNIQTHQSPKYHPYNPNYVYVKINNRGLLPSTGSNVLKIYANLPNSSIGLETSTFRVSSLSFPTNDSSIIAPTFSLQKIGSVTIPVVNAGETVILSIPWNVPDPRGILYCTSLEFNTFLYAKIISSTDAITVPETTDYYQNILNNNNIAGKNTVSIVPQNLINPEDNTIVYETSLLLMNSTALPLNLNLELMKEETETGKLIFEEAEVSLQMNETLFTAWERGGEATQNLTSTNALNLKLISTDNVKLNNINLLANEIGQMDLKFNFLTSEYTDKTTYTYHLVLKDTSTSKIVGGTTLFIEKPSRELFYADAGDDKEVDLNEPITISATEISEPAIYNWYDVEGNLIFTGKDLIIATQAATKFKLEVIATIDGFKDYSEVDVAIKPSILYSISPIPTSNNITVSYKLNEVGSAYIMILGSYGTTNASNNYVLDLNSTETTIDISNYPNGFYTVALICNGQIIDAKNLVKQ